MLLWSLLWHQDSGFYVDVGAHYPRRYSNTCFFYNRGWSGINIDADPDAVAALRRERPRDINVHSGVAAEVGNLEFIRYFEPAVNTFDRDLVRERERADYEHKVSSTIRVAARPLAHILREYLEPGHPIEFLSVDVEGMDLEVLQSNDWSAFVPRFVLAECYGEALEDLAQSATVRYLRQCGYEAVAKTLNTVICRLPEDSGR